jgi:hypothetical protein
MLLKFYEIDLRSYFGVIERGAVASDRDLGRYEWSSQRAIPEC